MTGDVGGGSRKDTSFDRVAALAAEARRDLSRIAHPRLPWLEPRSAPDGKPALDVLIIGAGQSGIAIAFGLMRAQVRNILVIDKAESGKEGPWITYARMRTLRSPKDYTGPDLDVPSLTYQAWHEARFGVGSWNALELIPRELWAEYLLWVREVTDVPVRNRCEVTDIAPAVGGLVAVTVACGERKREVLHARKIVLATGQEGMGGWWMPGFVSALPAHLRAHSADAIAFRHARGQDGGYSRGGSLRARQCSGCSRTWRRRGSRLLPTGTDPACPTLSLADLRGFSQASVGSR